MTAWGVLSTATLVMTLCVIAVTAAGCLWPTAPLPVRTRVARPHGVPSVPTPTAWTCALPGVPLDLIDAHDALRHHRGHDCPRTRAAFATLLVHGCVLPDTTRRPHRRATS